MIYSEFDNPSIPNGPLPLGMECVYYSKDIRKTLSWFNTVLGWLTKIELEDDAQTITYAIAYTVPYQHFSTIGDIQPKAKVHILQGEPRQEIVSIIPTTKLKKLVDSVNKVTEETITIQQAENGNLYAQLITVDGSILTFYQEASYNDL
ncbi:hypothetical protein [Enterococcus sp. BWR-S5]|uniref:hypothetical protein n=1 Tax=Enterococcus sp. BWR-S5 TaxID=2787714 RepID=UPI001921627F|nr:hypothetical protein [Enterococcus sp. BWR-S5]MBL1224465.1 hypothetical protein [Enterococcus sp. BWR-S5]